jgi:hypothetical protein
VLVPAPRQLTLERQLNKSVLISWTTPDVGPGNHIESYHVYVDGVLKTTIKATERTRALVEGVESNRVKHTLFIYYFTSSLNSFGHCSTKKAFNYSLTESAFDQSQLIDGPPVMPLVP